MATFSARLTSEFSFLETPQKQLSTTLEALNGLAGLNSDNLRATLKKDQPININAKRVPARIVEGIADVILDKIYFSPESIDAGIIVEDSTHDIKIWNASRTSNVNITQIQASPAAGLALINNGVPELLTCGNDLTHQLQVLKLGPPIQNSVVTYTIGGSAFTINVTGQRIVLFAFEPNAENGISVAYGLDTIIFENEFFVEQRVSRFENFLRVVEQEYLEELSESRRFLNDLKDKSKIVVGFPLYIEPLFFTGSIQGATVLTPDNADELEFFYNWQNLTTILCILSEDNSIEPEIKTISQVNAGNVVLDAPVQNAFTNGELYTVYPVFLGVIERFSSQVLHNEALQASTTQLEIRIDRG